MTLTTIAESQYILPLSSEEASLGLAGGKGMNLARLNRAGLPVPEGFLVTTRAYRDFVADNQLEDRIHTALPETGIDDPAVLEAASQVIRELFSEGRMPDGIAAGLATAYSQMKQKAVAVRSSATAEDLPGMSFAGQQDTYLNVIGVEPLVKAVIDCWSSLWTARAIGYRAHNGVAHASTALAVVVQEMVESQVSGVMFTANPLTGLRRETVIDATLGLGEALVSGMVEPDHYVVDPAANQIISKVLGVKALSIRSQAGGGTTRVAEAAEARQALPDAAIFEIARLGKQTAALYACPQDIEFAWVDGKPYLLQSRPVTSLFPTPPEMPADPLQVLVSFAAVQGMLDPMTPLGQQTFKMLGAAGARLFGRRYTTDTQTMLASAGERLWINFTPLLRNSVGRRITLGALNFVEPGARQSLLPILEDPRLKPGRPGIRFKALRQLAGFFLPLAGNVLLNLASPEKRRAMIVGRGEAILDTMQARFSGLSGDRWTRLVKLVDLMEEMITINLPRMFVLFVSGVAAGMASFAALSSLVSELKVETGEDWQDRFMTLTRGIPHNPTTEMDLTLWRTAQSIRQAPDALAEFQAYPPGVLAQRYLSGALAKPLTRIVMPFLDLYGARGLAEIDLGRPRWFEDPTHVFEVLGGYLRLEDPNLAPDAVFARGADAASQTLEALAAALRKTHGGRLKALRARFFGGRIRALMGVRESPKFFAIRMLGQLRSQLLKIGKEFVEAGELNAPDDLVYLTYAELHRLAGHEAADWKVLIGNRREAYQREALRRQVPRLLLSDGRAFYTGINSPEGEDGKTLTGSPVSPGSAEGRVRVVLDPRQANLQPGEILVCPGTDPSWTPLFLTAAGLVMEVGGMMTHGAVVAREYGIPAVVGVDQATRRLVTGQRIRLNGSSGMISLLDQV